LGQIIIARVDFRKIKKLEDSEAAIGFFLLNDFEKKIELGWTRIIPLRF